MGFLQGGTSPTCCAMRRVLKRVHRGLLILCGAQAATHVLRSHARAVLVDAFMTGQLEGAHGAKR